MEPMETVGCQELLGDGCSHEGHVKMESKNFVGSSGEVPRYLVLHKGCLYYYKDFNRTTPSGTLSLSGYQAAAGIEWRQQPWPFVVRNRDIEKKALLIACSSKEQRDKWIEKINAEVAASNADIDQQTDPGMTYTYAREPPVTMTPDAAEEQTNYEQMKHSDPLSASFRDPMIFPKIRLPPVTSKKPPALPSRSLSPTQEKASSLVRPTPPKPSLRRRPKSTDVTVNVTIATERKKKSSYELPHPINDRRGKNAGVQVFPYPFSSQPGDAETAVDRGVPDGETTPVSCEVYEKPGDVLPPSALRFDLDRVSSEGLLKTSGVPGMYLLRKDRSKANDVLSVIFGNELFHYKIFVSDTGRLHLDKKHPQFDSVPELIVYYYNNVLPTVDNNLICPCRVPK